MLLGDRIYLKPLEPADVAALLDLATENRDFFARREPERPPEYFTVEGQERQVEQVIAMRTAGLGVALGIFLREGDELIGRLGLFGIIRGGFQDARIGYMLAERHSGRGYATEAVELATAYAFSELGLHRLETGVQLDNPASARVLEKAGFRREGVSLRWVQAGREWFDCTRFALTVEEWNERRERA